MPSSAAPLEDRFRVAARNAIRRRGTTISAVAAATGIAQPNLSAWLSGRKPLPLRRIEAVLAHLHLRVRVLPPAA